MSDRIQAEIDRLQARLAGYPLPNEHAGLFAAQQALEWVKNPDAVASPFASVTGIRDEAPRPTEPLLHTRK